VISRLTCIPVSDERQLIATQVLGGFGKGIANAVPTGVVGFGNNSGFVPSRVNDVALFGAKPTWAFVEKDPAAVLGVQWQAELEALLDDNSINFANQEELKVLAALKGQGVGF
jgi:hypothetical protein